MVDSPFPYQTLKIIRTVRQTDGTPVLVYYEESIKNFKPVLDGQLWYLWESEEDDNMVPVYVGPDGLDFANANPSGFNGTLLGYAYRAKPDTAAGKAMRALYPPGRRVPSRIYPLQEIRAHHGTEPLGYGFVRYGAERTDLFTYTHTADNGDIHTLLLNNVAGASLWEWKVTIDGVVDAQDIVVHGNHFGFGWQAAIFCTDTATGTIPLNPNQQGGRRNSAISTWSLDLTEEWGQSDLAHGSVATEDGYVRFDSDGQPVVCGFGVPFEFEEDEAGGDSYHPIIYNTIEMGQEITLCFKGQNNIHRFRSIVRFADDWDVGPNTNSNAHYPAFISNYIYDQMWAYDLGTPGAVPVNLTDAELAYGGLPTITYTDDNTNYSIIGSDIAVGGDLYVDKGPFKGNYIGLILLSSDGGAAETGGWGPGNNFALGFYSKEHDLSGGKFAVESQFNWILRQQPTPDPGPTGSDFWHVAFFVDYRTYPGNIFPAGEYTYDRYVLTGQYDDVVAGMDWLKANGY